MNRRSDKWIAYLLVAVFAVLSLSCLGELVRKNDQVAILSGAIDLSRGHVQSWANYYQYDKCYVLYWVLAGVFKLTRSLSPVVVGNAFVCLFFWGALFFFVRRQPRVSRVALLACCCAPAILFNAVYVNSSVFASAFLLIAVVLLSGHGRSVGVAAGLSLFAATGSRIDIVLLLPFLIWHFMPASFFGARMFRWKKVWLIGLSALAALGLGLAQRETATIMVDPLFNLKVLAGYTAFGFGAMSLLYVAAMVVLLSAAVRVRGHRLFYLGGAIALLVPVLFYLGQLHTPRYFFRACEATLLFFCSRRGRVLFGAFGWRKPVRVITCAGCVLPLVLGLNLDDIRRPQLTLRNATCFPSGDGYYPMGAYLHFMTRLKRANREPIDHNQLVWAAVKSADLDFKAGPVPVLWSPMFGYFMLRASLENGVADCRGFSHWGEQSFYAETRTWMRADPKFGQEGMAALLDVPSTSVSEEAGGVEVRRFGAGESEWGNRVDFLNRIFSGNEYRIYGADQFSNLPAINGVFFSKSRKSLLSVLPNHAEIKDFCGFYYARVAVNEIKPGVEASSVMVATAVRPDWMSIQSFGGRNGTP